MSKLDEIIELVREERLRQDEKWGELPRATNSSGVWMLILMEEVGEAAEAFLYGRFDLAKEELIQVATVTIAWIEDMQIKREMTSNDKTND